MNECLYTNLHVWIWFGYFLMFLFFCTHRTSSRRGQRNLFCVYLSLLLKSPTTHLGLAAAISAQRSIADYRPLSPKTLLLLVLLAHPARSKSLQLTRYINYLLTWLRRIERSAAYKGWNLSSVASKDWAYTRRQNWTELTCLQFSSVAWTGLCEGNGNSVHYYGQYNCFRPSSFLCMHDNSRTAATIRYDRLFTLKNWAAAASLIYT